MDKPVKNYMIVDADRDQHSLVEVVRTTLSRAREAGLRPFIYFYSDLSRDCRALRRSLDDPAMVDTFDGAYVVKANGNEFRLRAREKGFRFDVPPAIFRLDDEGNPAGRIVPSDWLHQNTPEKMAEALKQFVCDGAGQRSDVSSLPAFPITSPTNAQASSSAMVVPCSCGSRLQPEVIANLWTFLGPFFNDQLIYMAAVRLYVATGSDAEKTAMLRSLATWDFHLAQVFPIPDGHVTHAGIPGAGVVDLKGVLPAGLGEHYLEYFQEAFDAVRRSLPEHPAAAGTQRPRLDTANLLHLHTPVDVDKNGNMTARCSDRRFAGDKPGVAANLWAFAGAGAGPVHALAGRAYLLSGARADQDRVLDNLAANDYLLARRLPVPELFSSGTSGQAMSGGVDVSGVLSQPDRLFAPVMGQIEQDIPTKYTDCRKEKTHRYVLPRDILIRRASVVREDGDGGVVVVPSAPASGIPVANPSPSAAELSPPPGTFAPTRPQHGAAASPADNTASGKQPSPQEPRALSPAELALSAMQKHASGSKPGGSQPASPGVHSPQPRQPAPSPPCGRAPDSASPTQQGPGYACDGAICDGQPGSGAVGADNTVAVFLGPDATRARDAVMADGASLSSHALAGLRHAVLLRGFSPPQEQSRHIVAATAHALETIYPQGRCAKCKGNHVQEWILVFSFHVPNQLGKRTTSAAIQAWAKDFNTKINQHDKRDKRARLRTGEFEWFVDIADSSGAFVVTSKANSEWLCRSAQAIDAAYRQMGGHEEATAMCPSGTEKKEPPGEERVISQVGKFCFKCNRKKSWFATNYAEDRKNRYLCAHCAKDEARAEFLRIIRALLTQQGVFVAMDDSEIMRELLGVHSPHLARLIQAAQQELATMYPRALVDDVTALIRR